MLGNTVFGLFLAVSYFLIYLRVCAINFTNSGITIRRVVDSRLDDVIATTHETTSFIQCIVHCLDNTQCMSVNWSPLTITDARETRTCELLTSQVADVEELQSAIGWQHFCKFLSQCVHTLRQVNISRIMYTCKHYFLFCVFRIHTTPQVIPLQLS